MGLLSRRTLILALMIAASEATYETFFKPWLIPEANWGQYFLGHLVTWLVALVATWWILRKWKGSD